MIIIVLCLLVFYSFNLIPELLGTHNSKTEKFISKILACMVFLVLTTTGLIMIGYRPKGLYTHPTIVLTFLLSSLLYFSVVSNSKKKLLIVLFISLTLLFAGTNLVFNRVIYESNIDNTRKVQVSVGGLLACGEIIHITETRFILFDKEIDKNTGLCLRGIERIELRKSRGLERIFEIYHDGTMDSENPYVFTHIK